MVTKRQSEFDYQSPWRLVLRDEHLLRIILTYVLQHESPLLPRPRPVRPASGCEGQPVNTRYEYTLHAEAASAYQKRMNPAILAGLFGENAAEIGAIIQRVHASTERHLITDPPLYVDDGSPFVPFGPLDSGGRPVHLDDDGAVPQEGDAVALAALRDSQASLRLMHRSWPVASVAAVCRLWRDVTKDILAQSERRSLRWRRAVVWTRMRRRAAARTQFPPHHRETLDVTLSRSISGMALSHSLGHRRIRDLLLNVIVPLIDIGASATPLDNNVDMGNLHAEEIIKLALEPKFPNNLEWFALLSELICGAGPMPLLRRFLVLPLDACVYTDMVQCVLNTMLHGDPWNSWLELKSEDLSNLFYASLHDLRRRRRCFGTFRTMLCARAFQAQYAKHTDILFQPFAESFPRRLQDRSVLFPDPTPSMDLKDEFVLRDWITRLAQCPCFDRGTSALLWDILLTLKLTGFGNFTAQLRTVLGPYTSETHSPVHCKYRAERLFKDFRWGSFLSTLRFVHQLHLLHTPKNLPPLSLEPVWNTNTRKMLEEALMGVLRVALGTRSGQRELQKLVVGMPEATAFVIEQIPEAVFKVCRMRRRRLLGTLLRAQPRRMRELAPQLLADMRAPTVRGLKHEIIEMLQRHIDNTALDDRADN